MTGQLVPEPGDAVPFCELCGQDGAIVNEVPADGGRAPWRRWTVSPTLVEWAHPELHPDPVTKEIRAWQPLVRCKDHYACRERVRSNGEAWDVNDGYADAPAQPELVSAVAGDDPLWGAP